MNRHITFKLISQSGTHVICANFLCLNTKKGKNKVRNETGQNCPDWLYAAGIPDFFQRVSPNSSPIQNHKSRSLTTKHLTQTDIIRPVNCYNITIPKECQPFFLIK